jgi:hypothetical protein
MDYIKSDPEQWIDISDDKNLKRKRRTTVNLVDIDSLWNTPWGRMLQHEEIAIKGSYQWNKFLRRFRVPFSMFKLIVKMCEEVNTFGKSKIPIDFKVLVSLRILGRGNCCDDISEFSFLGESTCNVIFKQFCASMNANFYNKFVYFPKENELQNVQDTYAKFGFPLACGSMDVTHIYIGKCPYALKVLATGKENRPTLAFQVVCGPNRQVFYCSDAYLGSYNDITITHNDPFTKRVNEGLLDDVKGIVIDDRGVPRVTTGGYLIVDGGYQKLSWLIDPYKNGCNIHQKIFSEMLESVRKDIECTFGIIKQRFRLFLNNIQFHKFEVIENAWKTAVMLHNMLIIYNAKDNINWVTFHPDDDSDSYEEMDDFIDIRKIDCNSLNIVRQTTPIGRTYSVKNDQHYTSRRNNLVHHFNFVYKLSLVKWPVRSDVGQRLRLRIYQGKENKSYNTNALYIKRSDFRSTIVEDYNIGNGLFSHKKYYKDDVIAVFNGTIMLRTVYDEVEVPAGRGGYAIAIKKDPITNAARVLNCYNQRKNNICFASCSNNAKNCINITTNTTAVNNCKIIINSNDVVKLVCNRKCGIEAHTELAWNYGNEYQFDL